MTLIQINIDIRDEQEAARVLALLNREQIPHRVQKKPALAPEELAQAHERIMRGAPTLNVNAMLDWLKESKEDRKLPFRDDE